MTVERWEDSPKTMEEVEVWVLLFHIPNLFCCLWFFDLTVLKSSLWSGLLEFSSLVSSSLSSSLENSPCSVICTILCGGSSVCSLVFSCRSGFMGSFSRLFLCFRCGERIPKKGPLSSSSTSWSSASISMRVSVVVSLYLLSLVWPCLSWEKGGVVGGGWGSVNVWLQWGKISGECFEVSCEGDRDVALHRRPGGAGERTWGGEGVRVPSSMAWSPEVTMDETAGGVRNTGNGWGTTGPGGERVWRRKDEGDGRWEGGVPGAEEKLNWLGLVAKRGRNEGIAKCWGETGGTNRKGLRAGENPECGLLVNNGKTGLGNSEGFWNPAFKVEVTSELHTRETQLILSIIL